MNLQLFFLIQRTFYSHDKDEFAWGKYEITHHNLEP